MKHTKKNLKAETEKIFGRYTEDEALEEFNIFHMYGDGKPCIFYDNGYVDAQNFNLMGYNTKTKKKRDLGRHDSLNLSTECKPDIIRIFMDGSTMVRFRDMVILDGNYQAQEIKSLKEKK